MRATYLLVLAGCLLGAVWLEFALRTRVFRRWKRLALSLVRGFVLFVLWDLYAITNNHWSFDPNQIVGFRIGGIVPIEELLFFVVIPTCAVLSFEAVRSATGWLAGDESVEGRQ